MGVHNSFLGKREVVDVLLEWNKTDLLFSKTAQSLIRIIGPALIRTFGLPMVFTARKRARTIFSYLKDEPLNTAEVLEVGCSVGTTATFELARRAKQVTAIDINLSSLMTATKIKNVLNLSNLNLLLADAANLAFSSSKFDYIICTQTLEHIPDDEGFIRQCNRVLKPGGILILDTPYDPEASMEQYERPVATYAGMPSDSTNDTSFTGAYHVRSHYTEPALTSLLQKNGFQVLHTSTHRAPIIRLAMKPYLFPLLYPLLYIFSGVCGDYYAISVKAKKRKGAVKE